VRLGQTVCMGELEVLVSGGFFRRSELECWIVRNPNGQSVNPARTVCESSSDGP
jgi:hypothetical protein